MGYDEVSEDDLMSELDKPWGIGSPEQDARRKIVAALMLLRRRTGELADSSRRLECLTKWLIGLAVVLALLTLVLAVPEFGKLIGWLRVR